MPTQKIALAAGGALIFILILAGLYTSSFLLNKKTVSENADVLLGTVPISGNAQSTSFPTPSSSGQGGRGTGLSVADDFIAGTDVVTSISNPDNLYVVYPPDNVSSTTSEYEINYFPSTQSFIIGIFQEPIGEIRRRVAADLAGRLHVSGKDVCALSVNIIVPVWVNEYYAHQNIGFPGCPGAVKFQGD